MENQILHDLHSCCEKALYELYPAGIPCEISQRFEREMHCLMKRPGCLDNFLLFKEISDAAKQTCGKIYLAGTITNSILVYLLGDHELNPMPAHYYCPHCGYYHEQPKTVVGLDLPEETCPHCGTVLRKDGFSLREEYVWKNSTGPDFEYRITARILPLVHKIIEQHYAKQQLHTALLGLENVDNKLKASGIVIFPSGKRIVDYYEFSGTTYDGKDCLCYDWQLFDKGDLKKILLLQTDVLDVLDAMQWKIGVLADSITANTFTDVSCQDIFNASVLHGEDCQIFNKIKPTTFREKMDLITATHNTYQELDNNDLSIRFAENPLFLSCPIYTRDDAYDMLRAIYKDADKAFLDAENIRKGRLRHSRYVLDPAVPESFKAIVRHIGYLFPRAFGQWYMLQYMRLSQYQKLDRNAYYNVIRREKLAFSITERTL